MFCHYSIIGCTLSGSHKKFIMLIESDKVKSYLGISDSSYDSLLNDLCAGVSKFIADFLDRDIEQGTTTEYLDGADTLVLKNYPLLSVTSVKYNAGTQAHPVWYTIDPVNYVVYKLEGKIMTMKGLVRGFQNIEVVYEAGFETIPEDIVMVAMQLVAKMFETRKAQGKLKEFLGGAQIDWKDELTVEQKQILAGYFNFAL
jgi:hypothetical protein